MTIRPMAIRDYEAVRALWESAEGIGLSDADSRDGVDRMLQRNPGLSFVAEEGSQIVGAILVGHDGRRGFIHHLVVAPALQRRELGRARPARLFGR